MRIAEATALRGSCDRAQVGCILVKDKVIVSTGYNGSLPGAEHCDDVGHLMSEGHCIRTLHAEMNAVVRCWHNGHSPSGTIAYCTHAPCSYCYKLLKAAGIIRIVVRNDYGSIKFDDVEVLNEASKD